MTEPPVDLGGLRDVPTFSECVVGYRRWSADAEGQLWPLHSRRRPWQPGVNTARCNCRTPNGLKFDWSWHEGRRVLEPAAEHLAPSGDCVCGLYSWRRPPAAWSKQARLSIPPAVVGAVASWGRIQVHDTGFRAEHACVVTLAYHPDTGPDAIETLRQIAEHYRVATVPITELEQAASQHGSPLPDAVGPARHRPRSQQDLAAVHHSVAAPDATPSEVRSHSSPRSSPGHSLFIDPLRPARRRLGFRARAGFLALESCVAIALVVLAVITYTGEAKSSYVQSNGIHATGRVQSINENALCGSRGPCYPTTRLTVKLTHPVHGISIVRVRELRAADLTAGQRVNMRLDPADPAYGEVAGQPRTAPGIWIIAAVLAAVALIAVIRDGRSVTRLRRPHQHPATRHPQH